MTVKIHVKMCRQCLLASQVRGLAKASSCWGVFLLFPKSTINSAKKGRDQHSIHMWLRTDNSRDSSGWAPMHPGSGDPVLWDFHDSDFGNHHVRTVGV